MKLASVFLARLRWLNLPGAMLVALLQRTPVLRVAAVVEERVASSPVGAVLRSAAAALGSLGAVHALAGATQFQFSRTSPISATTGVAISPIAFTVTGALTPAGSFRITGLPPGLSVTNANSNGVLNGSSGVIAGTPTTAGTYTVSITAWEFADLRGDSFGPARLQFDVAQGAATAPIFTTQPASQTVAVGSNATFNLALTASPAATIQWRRGGTTLSGQTGTTLTLTNVQTSDAGDYTAVAANSAGTVTSNVATLTVVASASAPTFIAEPAPQTIPAGATVVFSAAASGAPAPSFQWQRNGADLPGATRSMLVLSGAAALAGEYTVVARNAGGATPSRAAALGVANSENFGHLINLSILAPLEPSSPDLTVGFVVGGAGTSGAKPLLVRAAGPSLAAFNLNGANADPQLELYSGSRAVDRNNDWGGAAALVNAFIQVGAFSYATSTSKDAALMTSVAVPAPAGENSTIQVSGVNGATGTVITELYDAGATSTFAATTPRLINVSVRKAITAGSTLTAGFVIGGTTSRTVLVRAIGPELAVFGVPGAMQDPQLTLFNSTSVKIAENDNWGGDAQLTAAGTSVGAFPLSNPASKDAVLLITLPPGPYTAQVTGVGGTGGTALVEVYEVP